MVLFMILNSYFQKVKFKETDIYQTYKLVLDNPEGMQHHLFGNQGENI